MLAVPSPAAVIRPDEETVATSGESLAHVSRLVQSLVAAFGPPPRAPALNVHSADNCCCPLTDKVVLGVIWIAATPGLTRRIEIKPAPDVNEREVSSGATTMPVATGTLPEETL